LDLALDLPNKGLKLLGKEMIAIGVNSEAEHENHQDNFHIYFGTLYIVKLGALSLVKGNSGSQPVRRASQ
jgi:hypothetical protein